jgi:hypothetical protein
MTRADKKYLKAAGVLWTACLAAFLLAYFLVLVPQAQTRDELDAELATKDKALADAREYAARQAKGLPEKEIDDLQRRFGDFVFDPEGSGDLTFTINQIATDRQIPSSVNINVGDRKGSGKPDFAHIAESTVDISFTAGFNQFLNLTNALERHRPVVFVDTFAITRSRKADARHPVSMKLAVLLAQDENPGSSDAKVVRGTPVP